jgi:hypothetical protein
LPGPSLEWPTTTPAANSSPGGLRSHLQLGCQPS